MKRFTLTLSAIIASTMMAWCGITLGVPVQLLHCENNLLPDKTIEVTHKQLKIKDKAPATLVAAIDSLTHIVVNNAGNCRTYALHIDPKCTTITIIHHDPLAQIEMGAQVMGSYIVAHCHFLVMRNNENNQLLNSTFKTTSNKIKYVREFEFVDDRTPPLRTHIEAHLDNQTLIITHSIVENQETQGNQ